MFKYGSLRLFFTKFIVGSIGTVFSAVYLISLFTYNINDPGFNSFYSDSNNQTVLNWSGKFGAYLSSYSIILFGHLSYLFAIFVLHESLKLFLGIKNNYFFLKLPLIFIGIIFVNFLLKEINFERYQIGLISNFIINLFSENVLSQSENFLLYYLINIFIFVLGILIILFSFSIKFKYFYRSILIIKYLKIFNILRYLPKRTKSVKATYSSKKNEPTFQRKGFFKSKEAVSKKPKFNQLEIDRFKFNLPKIELLNKTTVKVFQNKELDKINNDSAKRLEQTLAEYGVEGEIVDYKCGPIVTLFEFVPRAGIKSSKVIGLSDDIARAMSSFSARISSQPGKTSLGIEIPNTKRGNVLFGDLIESEKFKNNDSLTLALGKDISGEKVFADLEKMPHLLIAGTTGSGKSVGINTMILSLLFKFKPNECKLILIDPKMLELSIYEDIPHLLTPVVTDPKKAVYALKWVVREMENRYKLMSSINVKNIESYNNKVVRNISIGRKLFREVQTGIDSDTKMPIFEKKEIPLEKMPFIVVVIDEMADLMMVAGKEVESLVQRLAQMARASGIHLITATQRPSVDVITGTIKANFPSRISYKVASKFDSRTILNEMGAEQLLGSGDMLFLENGANIKRLHGGFVSENEVEKIVSFIKSQATFDHKKEISLIQNNNDTRDNNDLISNNSDDLYSSAVDIVVKQQKVSTSYIQRYLQIGYNRAARIVEKMEEDGIITEANNAGKRHVIKKE